MSAQSLKVKGRTVGTKKKIEDVCKNNALMEAGGEGRIVGVWKCLWRRYVDIHG